MSEEIQKSTPENNHLTLNNGQVLNLDGLPEEKQIELRKKQAEGMLELQKTMIERGIDTKDIDQRMTDIANNVGKATADQSAATITGSYNDKMGRTEVIMGNTETAQKGKLSRSQQGESDKSLLYAGIGVGVVILLAIILSN